MTHWNCYHQSLFVSKCSFRNCLQWDEVLPDTLKKEWEQLVSSGGVVQEATLKESVMMYAHILYAGFATHRQWLMLQ